MLTQAVLRCLYTVEFVFYRQDSSAIYRKKTPALIRGLALYLSNCTSLRVTSSDIQLEKKSCNLRTFNHRRIKYIVIISSLSSF
jgi:hypothetical protein